MAKEEEKGAEVPEKGTTPEPLPEEHLTREAVDKLIAQRLEESRRAFQQAGDKQAAEAYRRLDAEKRQRLALEEERSSLRARLSELDPEAAKEQELAELRRERSYRSQMEQYQSQAQTFQTAYYKDVREVLTQMGVDPDDPELDYAPDAQDFLTGQKRLLQSAAKLVTKKQAKALKEGLDEAKTELRKELKELRKDLGMDTQTEIPTGAVKPSLDALLKKDVNKMSRAELAKYREELYKELSKGG